MRVGEDGVTLASIADDRLLPGEDPRAAEAEDVVHWVTVYEELFRFTAELITTTRATLSLLPDAAQRRVKAHDLPLMLQASMRLERRLEFWRQRLSALRQGRTA